ncbi:hypothetical protein FB451DRAFT_212465 [Mycena latifolia]|nr:hypothetical protein FB451DRAFT_212465 [Mycena latifolia]
MRSVTILFGVLLAGLTPVSGKGGGKASGGKSNQSGSSQGGSSGKSQGKSSGGSSVTIINTGGTTVCYNENNQIIRCPPNSARKNMIIGAVVGGILGSILLAFLIYWVTMRIRKKRQQRQQNKTILPSISFGKQDYKQLHDQSDEH